MGWTWLRAPGTTDDSACAMARNAARSENARDPPHRRERLEIRSLADSQAPLYFIRLSCEKYTPGQTYIGVLRKNVLRHCAKFAPADRSQIFASLREHQFRIQ